MKINEHAPAKINLGLRILGKRPDGYHNILSIFQTVDIFDTLLVSDEDEPGLACNDITVSPGKSNLICRAEEVFQNSTGIKKGVRFELLKHIPIGAGLGGGSSDAAAALRVLDVIHDTRLDRCNLEIMGATLGSDVPFLVTGGTAIISGRGENIQPVTWPFDFTYVIVFPGFGVSTAWAYGALEGFGDADDYITITGKLKDGTLGRSDFTAALVNDFEPVVFRAYPVLGDIKNEMLLHGAAAAVMSGSGSSMIALFNRETDALNCRDHMHARYPVVHTARVYPSERIHP